MSLKEYNQLKEVFSKVSIASDVEGILHWDMSTMMPSNSRHNRANQLAFIANLKHSLLSDPSVADLISNIDISQLSKNDLTNFREMKREYVLLSSLPSDLVEAISKTSALCEGKWQEAKKNCDFSIVKSSLNDLINLSRQESEILSEKLNCSPYEALIQKYEPYSNADHITKVFKDLEIFLLSSIDKIIEKQKKESVLPIEDEFSSFNQHKIAKILMKTIGFDFTKGRLDKSEHPFCGGATEDVRITTRYSEKDPFSSLEGVMHETGHALYELGLPSEWQHQPVGRSRGMAMHESQSLLIEMQITRSLAFKKYLSKILKENLSLSGKEWSAENLYLLGTQVNKTYIRVEADEVTYPLHIIMRFNLEKQIINGDLSTNDIPEAWNTEYKKMFGKNVDKDTNGCLQDIHWYAGLIGYFPTYTLGALASAQFAETIRKEIPKLDQNIEDGNFKALITWLKRNIHQKGSFFTTNEILEQVTKSSLHAKYFKESISNRYL